MIRPKLGVTIVSLLTAALLLGGCAKSEDRTRAPSALTFADPAPILLQGIPISLRPTIGGGDRARSFRVEPALPAGLALDEATGVISGAPVDLLSATTYTVFARNRGGETSTELMITVHPQAPCGLAYDQTDVKYVGQISVVENVPLVGCGPADLWTVAPALPAGLALDPTTGVIAGTPTELIPRTQFLVTAENITGSGSVSIHIEVETPAPCSLTYSDPEVVYPPGVSIAANVPSSVCGAVETYEISPALPAGLSFDASTGVISGTPTVEGPMGVHTVTATNVYGSTSTELEIRIAPVFTFTADATPTEYDPVDGSGGVEARLFIEEGSNNLTYPTPIVGVSLAIAHDATHLAPLDVAPGADLLAFSAGAGPDYFAPVMQSNAVTVGVLFSFDLSELLIADVPRELAVVQYETEELWLAGDTDGAQTQLYWGNPNASPPISNEVGLSGVYSVRPVLIDSTISLDPAPMP